MSKGVKQPRGGGYWIWKSHIIKKINEINDNDILIYLDAGCSINKFVNLYLPPGIDNIPDGDII